MDEKYLKLIRGKEMIRVTCRGEFRGGDGYAVAVHTDRFDFDVITNPGEVFSNYSGPPEYARHTIAFADVLDVRLT